MTYYREEIMAVLWGEKTAHMPFVPEMLVWYKWNRKAGTLPPQYRRRHRGGRYVQTWASACFRSDTTVDGIGTGDNVVVTEYAAGTRRLNCHRDTGGERYAANTRQRRRLDWTVSNFVEVSGRH